MSSITFHFRKEAGTLGFRFLKAEENSCAITVDKKEAATAVSEIFNKLIATYPDKYKEVLLGLKDFEVTISTDHNTGDSGLIIAGPHVSLNIKKLKTGTAGALKKPLETPRIIRTLFEAQFFSTLIQRTSADPKNEQFGTYLIERLLGPAESYQFNDKSLEFTMTFEKERAVSLDKLPEGKSAATLERLKSVRGCSLIVAKEVKGKFDTQAAKICFEPNSLSLKWGVSASLLALSETHGAPDTVKIQGECLSKPANREVLAQDFVDMLECNITPPKKA